MTTVYEVTLKETNGLETIVYVEDCADLLDVEDYLLSVGFSSRAVASAVIKEMAV